MIPRLALILLLIAPSWALAEPEQMVCTLTADHYFEAGKEIEANIAKDNEKTLYIGIKDEILAINYEASSASIFKQNHAYSASMLGLRNRKFISLSDFAAEVIIVGGEKCSYGDKEQRKATWMTTYRDGFISSVLSCKCN